MGGWLRSENLDRPRFDRDIEFTVRGFRAEILVLELDHVFVSRLRLGQTAEFQRKPQ